jgi:hypothetical protein
MSRLKRKDGGGLMSKSTGTTNLEDPVSRGRKFWP